MFQNKRLIAPASRKPYIDLISGDNITSALEKSIKDLKNIPIHTWERLDNRSYFPGKWTLNELLQHVIDTERIFDYRALTIARQDGVEIHGFNQDAYVAVSTANKRSIEDLLQELVSIRIATYYLYKNFNFDILATVGNIHGNDINVEAIGYITLGHQIHHFNVIQERYIPLLQS